MARTEVEGLREWIARASETIGRVDAERLAAFGLRTTWAEMQSSLDRDLDATVLRALDALLRRRLNDEPLAYIEGSRGFYGLELFCGPGVLVPRPDSETLVDVALELIGPIEKPVVVDLCTGTGAIALAIKSQRGDAEVVATDISDDALAYARRNVDALQLDVWIARGDLFDAVPEDLRGRVDLVVANPPYVRDDESLPPDVLQEPALALRAGADGCDVLRRIVADAPRWLQPHGSIALEIGDASQADVLSGGSVRNDLAGLPRVVWRQLGSR